MEKDSLLEPLVSALATARNVIDHYRDHVSKNEIRTREVAGLF